VFEGRIYQEQGGQIEWGKRGGGMQCSKCQFDNESGALFCNECGTKLEFACPQCGKVNAPGSKFCNKCGQALGEAAHLSPTPNAFDKAQPQSYTPKHLADKILNTRSALEGERKLVTVLFADVANFTSLSEKLEPEEVHQIMEGCLRILMDEIHQYEGTINQFTGDGVMALFGAPLAHEDHAQRACYAALAVQKDLAEYSEKVRKDFGQEFRMRIGLNSGPVVVGSIGDDLHMDYTAIGDTINLASRMEGLARPGTVLLSRDTHRLIKDYFDLNPIGPLDVKGKEEPQEAFELVKTGGALTRLEASMARGLTRFVGRENSMAALMEAYEKVRNGAGQIVGVVGEAGVGKSRLLFEFRHRLLQEEFGYLEGRCIHFGGAMPYLPILDLLRSYFEIREGEREMVIRKRVRERILGLDEKLRGIISPILDLLSLKVEDEAYLKLEPKQRREKVFEALRDLFIRESQERPLVIVIEDLHWIDKTSEEFLDYLIGWLANVKVMLVLLYRPEYTHSWGNKSYFNRIGLDQLTLKSSAELVRAILEGGETAPELSNLILNRAAGNPLFMEELTHSLLENGSIQRTGDQYILTKKSSDLQVPDTIQGIIAARIDRLDENLKRIMQVASVIGREFTFRILQAISDMREDLKTELLNLQGLELIYEKSLLPELEYIFKHALTQEVAYNSLLLKRRKEIHEKTGKAIEELYPERLEEFYEVLAYHYSRSDNLEKAYEYLKKAAGKAVQKDALFDSLRFYKDAMEVLLKLPPTDENKREQTELILSMYFPEVRIGLSENFLPLLQKAEALSVELGDDKNRLIARDRLGIYFIIKGNDPDLGWKYIESCFDHPELIQDIELMAITGSDLCASCSVSGDYLRIDRVAPTIISLIENTQTQAEFHGFPFNPYCFILGSWGMAKGFLAYFDKGETLLKKALSFAEEINHRATIGLIKMNYGNLLVAKGDASKAIRILNNAIKDLEESQTMFAAGSTWAMLGVAHWLTGDYRSALEFSEKGLKIQTDLDLPMFESLCHWSCSLAHFGLGNLEEAKIQAEQALHYSMANNEKQIQGLSKIVLGKVLAKADPGQIETAEGHLLRGISLLEELGTLCESSMGYLWLGEAYAESGRQEEALENLNKAEAMFQEMGMDYWLDKTREILGKL
jgi:class 3 adenylate cyclase/tetratricopeptide (TPR) repeat protein